MPKEAREGGREGGDKWEERQRAQKKEWVIDRERETANASSGLSVRAHGQWVRDLCFLSAQASSPVVSSLWLDYCRGKTSSGYSSSSPCLPLSPLLSTSLPTSHWGTAALLLPRSHLLFSSHPPFPCFPLRMSCEEAQLHKERLQALAVSHSV